MSNLNKTKILNRLVLRIKDTHLFSELTEKLDNRNNIDKLFQSISNANHSVNELPLINSSKQGWKGVLFNKIILRIYWTVRNSVGPALNTQKSINQFFVDILKVVKETQENNSLHISEIKNLSTNKTNLYNKINYASFEEENRANEQELSLKQEMYLKYFIGKENILDVGCGRGEFLKILEKHNISCMGIDLNEDFVRYDKEQGLHVELINVMDYLESCIDNSLGGIIALQVIEHLQPYELTKFISLAYKKIDIDGVIILETLNPQSLIIFSSSYYKDLTHIQPLHPATIQFLLKSVGFVDCKIEYSSYIKDKGKLKKLEESESNQTINENIDTLNNLLFGPQDYAAIGTKK